MSEKRRCSANRQGHWQDGFRIAMSVSAKELSAGVRVQRDTSPLKKFSC